MEQFSCLQSRVSIGNLMDSDISALLTDTYKKAKKAILVDEHTNVHCLPLLFLCFDGLSEAEIIEIPAGEEHKTMEICLSVWETLSEMEFGRNDLLICLGGGVVCDMGGFVAALFKRGMKCWYIPTTLLSMVDASLGGKTGVDLESYKNQLGVFSAPQHVFIDRVFLETLPAEEKRNGLAEMLKHGLIADKGHFKTLSTLAEDEITDAMLLASLHIKQVIVESDPEEKGRRKLLNFGHTIGHAIEGTFLGTEKQMSHGLAVAHGMLYEARLSEELGLLSEKERIEIESVLQARFSLQTFSEKEVEDFIQLMRHDKKNEGGKFRFTLLKEIGNGVINQEVNSEMISKVFSEK